MEFCKTHILAFIALLSCISVAHSWGVDGHFITCKLAQPRLSKAAANAVSELLGDNDLASLCSWADHVKFRYHWSSPLHYIDTPDNLCTYQYNNNLTEALLFLSHFIGDIHQVWDDSIIETAEERFYDSNVDELINTLHKNISTVWANQAKAWEACSKTACPDIYASEGIEAACDWAYKGVSEGSVLEDDYFLSRYPVVNMRLAQGGVRLAATLNRIFG
ncbi:hypothetical protein DH2020_032129 [Rehmannia glutinosa]|uniref:Aspergillus nuclease S1 n=1 Tax=Rehmannia glutinosa TaxID=99300 RepID=A0ABR0VJ52_REHGL